MPQPPALPDKAEYELLEWKEKYDEVCREIEKAEEEVKEMTVQVMMQTFFHFSNDMSVFFCALPVFEVYATRHSIYKNMLPFVSNTATELILVEKRCDAIFCVNETKS